MRRTISLFVALALATALAASCGKKGKRDEKEPTTAAGYVRRATDNFMSPDKAIKDCNKAIELDSDYAPAYAFRAEQYEKLYQKTDKPRHAKKAIADYDRLLELDPEKEEATDYYRKRGHLKMAIDDFDGAINDFQSAVKRNRTDSRSFEYLAKGFLARNTGDDRDKAITAYGYAIRYDSRNTAYLKARAGIFREMKDYDRAIRDLKKVVDIQPDNATYIALGDIYLEMDERLEAAKWYDKVKEPEDDDEDEEIQ